MTTDPRPDGNRETRRFSRLTYEDFRALAKDPSLSAFEKIGFPNAFREEKEPEIYADILRKLGNLSIKGASVLDVGPGCSELPKMLVEHALQLEHGLVLMDSQEMLDLLPDGPNVTKVAGRFPQDRAALGENANYDVVLVYSVLQHVFLEANPFVFIDDLLTLLRPGGELLLGDIPNISKLDRFLDSEAGAAHHREYMRTDDAPVVPPHRIEHGRLDDAAILAILGRARAAGFDAYVLPQPPTLPMSNRREDIYIRRP